MNIIHFTHGKVNPEGSSGISRVVYALNKHEKLLGHNSKILSVVDGQKTHGNYIRDEYVNVEMFPRIGYFNKNNPIFDYIESNSNKIDIVHIHHMWFWDKNPIINLCNRLNIPTIMTLHDNYCEYMFHLKKRVIWNLYEKKYANKVSAYRGLCNEEYDRIRKLGISSPVYINYNSINAKENLDDSIPNIIKENDDRIIITNISRINKRKNQLNIIEAINQLDNKYKSKILILIIGGGDISYIEKIKSKIKEYNLNNQVKYLGPIYGDEKWNFIKNSNGYIHVSHTDVISISILEAMVSGKACIISRSCKVSYLYKYGFFVMCEPYIDSITDAITSFCDQKSNHDQMGLNAKELAFTQFSHETIVNRMISIYKKVINNG